MSLTRYDAATIIQKYARRMIVLNTIDPWLGPGFRDCDMSSSECHWCGECGEDIMYVKSYKLYGCRECVSECGDDY